MRMLISDEEMFAAKFPSANNFLLAASLRYEVFELICERDYHGLNESKLARLMELLNEAPACKEAWFVEKLREEFPRFMTHFDSIKKPSE